jgi:UDP-N-acetylmuramyl tripeptide synthase
MISNYVHGKLHEIAVRIIANGETRTVYWINSRCSLHGDDDEIIGTYSANRTLGDLLEQLIQDFETWFECNPARLDSTKRKLRQ